MERQCPPFFHPFPAGCAQYYTGCQMEHNRTNSTPGRVDERVQNFKRRKRKPCSSDTGWYINPSYIRGNPAGEESLHGPCKGGRRGKITFKVRFCLDRRQSQGIYEGGTGGSKAVCGLQQRTIYACKRGAGHKMYCAGWWPCDRPWSGYEDMRRHLVGSWKWWCWSRVCRCLQ